MTWRSKINLKILKPSRKPVTPGDIFVFQLLEDRYHYGRVIKVEESGGPIDTGFLLLYCYNATSPVKEQIPSLNRDDLIIPPEHTIRKERGWIKGYFETIAHVDLTPDDILPIHCFWSFCNGIYCDEYGNPLPERIEPCGLYGVGSFASIDDKISKRLGLPTE